MNCCVGGVETALGTQLLSATHPGKITQIGEQKPATVHASLPPTSPLKLYGGGALGTQDLGSYGFIWDDIETGSAHERLETGTIVSLLFVHFLLL